MLALTAYAKEGRTMGTLTIRKINDEVKEKLRIRAAHHGRSMEAEVREILASAVESPSPESSPTSNYPPVPEYGLGTWLHNRFKEAGLTGLDLDIPERTEMPRIIDFDE
jgi:hypothetical protein